MVVKLLVVGLLLFDDVDAFFILLLMVLVQ